jgi:hypothetical protein
MIRSYQDSDYDQLRELYGHTKWYGGVFDEARDGRDRLNAVIQRDPEAILVYEEDGALKGTISIIEDGRVAMLYRFVVPPAESAASKQLYDTAVANLKARGHSQILVYSAPGNPDLDARYAALGMQRGGDYACFWADI